MTRDVSNTADISGLSGFRETHTVHVLDQLRHHLARYIRTVTEGDLDLLALWIAHTHLVTETYTTPRLVLDSPLPGSGKTTVLDHCDRLALNPVMASALDSPALVPRLLRNGPRTILIDEADRSLDQSKDGVGALLAIINSGYRRGGQRPVLVPSKEEGWVEHEMSTYCPIAIAGNAPNLPDDTLQRCIRVLLFQDLDETVEESDWELIEDDVQALAGRIEVWADEVRETIRTTRPPLPDGIKGRNREKWGPLKRVATVAGAHWPAIVDSLALADLAQQQADRDDGLSVEKPHIRLLRDLVGVWPTDGRGDPRGFAPTDELTARLAGAFPDEWGQGSPFGKPITPQRMGRMLAGNYRLMTSRPDTHGKRGYALAHVRATWGLMQITPPGETGATGYVGGTGSPTPAPTEGTAS